jgi:hypothetical protein
MRQRLFFGAILAAVIGITAPAPAIAQGVGLGEYYVPSTPLTNAHIPTGKPQNAGFYSALEFFYLSQTRTMNNQVIARRGFIDSGGLITGTPGTFRGSGATALQTDDLGKSSWAPGFAITLGWKTDDGVAIYGKFLQTPDTVYTAGATFVGRNFRGDPSLADSFITADVFNFPTDYAGPFEDTSFDRSLEGFPGGNTYGLWNAAEEMTIRYRQRFTAGEIGSRVPLFQTEYSRVYGLAGLRYGWFFERFTWRTADRNVDGVALPEDSAVYTNTLSQRMYGPFVGCGHEIYMGKAFAVGVDATAGGLLSINKERIKYRLGDPIFPTQNKRSSNQFRFVPNVNVDANLSWYPLEGVQVRLGYNLMSYFNTTAFQQPVTFDFGNLNPTYGSQAYRMVHGFNVGVGFFF